MSTVEVLGTSGDDHIVITINPTTHESTVTGASNIADGTVFPASTSTNRMNFLIDAGDGNDYVEVGLEPADEHGSFNHAARSTLIGGRGNDTLIGGSGGVTLNGGAGNDTLVARSSSETKAVEFTGATSGIHVNLQDGKVYNDGQGGIDQISGVASVSGTPFDDKIYSGGIFGGWLDGLDGNDLLVASPGDQTLGGLSGGDGDDTLIAGDGGTQLYPGKGDDYIFGGAGFDSLKYDQGTEGALIRLDLGLVLNDGSGGRDFVEQIDSVSINSSHNDTIVGSAGNDEIMTHGGVDLISGGDGNDRLVLEAGIMLGGAGDDNLNSNSSLVLIDGGAGADSIKLHGKKFLIEMIVGDPADTLTDNRYAPEPDEVSPVNTLVMPPAVPQPVSDIEVNIVGTSGDDRIFILFGQAGEILIFGAPGIVDGTSFIDVSRITIDGGDGNDRIELLPGAAVGAGGLSMFRATLRGGAGDDTLVCDEGLVTLDGGAGDDRIVATGDSTDKVLAFSGAAGGVVVRLHEGMVLDDGQGGSDEVSGVSNVFGTDFDDVIHSSGSGVIEGRGGNDLLVASKLDRHSQLIGGTGDDTILAGRGNVIYGGAGNDDIRGGSRDQVMYEGTTGRVLVRLDRGYIKDGSGGTDRVAGIVNVTVDSPFSDVIYGNDSANNLGSFGGGADLVVGKGGADRITADGGILIGGAGNDVISTNSSLVLISSGDGSDKINLFGKKWLIEKLFIDDDDTLTDKRFAASTADMPQNTLKLPQKKSTAPSPTLVFSHLRLWN